MSAKRTEVENYNTTRERVFEIIANDAGVSFDRIAEDKAFVHDFKMDQAAHERVRADLESEVGCEITIDDAEKITTVQKAINYVFIHQQTCKNASNRAL
jgi:acyl carrier protein